MNRSFPLKIDCADVSLDPATIRRGKQRLVQKKKLSHLKEIILEVRAAAGVPAAAPILAPAADSAGGLLQKTLSDLARFQRRAREEQPLKAAKAQRLLFGLREISRSLENQKPPIAVITASNIVDEPILEELRNLEIVCRARNVLFISDLLSRNQLGRAAGKPVRQSAVAIVSVEGANLTWKSLLALLPPSSYPLFVFNTARWILPGSCEPVFEDGLGFHSPRNDSDFALSVSL